MGVTASRVVVTGIGVISPNGKNNEGFWNSVLFGKSGIKPIVGFDTSEYSTRIAGQITDFNPEEFIERNEARRMSRFSQFAISAAKIAILDSGFHISNDNNQDIGVILGVSVNGFEIIEKEMKVLFNKGCKFVNPFTVFGVFPNSAAGHIAISLGIKGRSLTISTGCSSSLNAIGHAYELIKYNKLKSAICGGAEAPITSSILSAFCAANSLSKRNDEPEKASRPFDKTRDGYLLSEGAAMFVLENLEQALKRNAKIYAEVIGYANTSEAYSMYKMDETGDEAARAINMAIQDAGINYKEIDYISAHGSSSYVSDIRETRAIKKVLNGHSYKVHISSIKSMIGHPLGAAGGLQAAATILAGKYGYIPPTINYKIFDPECDLNYVPNEAIRKKINVALVNSFGMGGNNSSLVLRINV